MPARTALRFVAAACGDVVACVAWRWLCGVSESWRWPAVSRGSDRCAMGGWRWRAALWATLRAWRGAGCDHPRRALGAWCRLAWLRLGGVSRWRAPGGPGAAWRARRCGPRCGPGAGPGDQPARGRGRLAPGAVACGRGVSGRGAGRRGVRAAYQAPARSAAARAVTFSTCHCPASSAARACTSCGRGHHTWPGPVSASSRSQKRRVPGAG